MHDRARGIRLRSVSGENMDTGDTISCSGLAKSGLDLDLGMKTMIHSSGHSCSCCCYKGTLAVVTSSRQLVAPVVAPGWWHQWWHQQWWQSADDLKRWGPIGIIGIMTGKGKGKGPFLQRMIGVTLLARFLKQKLLVH